MPCDALFQLGMGSARLNASQKEETFGARALGMSAEVACVSRPGRRSKPATDLRRIGRPAGNSSKARIPAGSAAAPARA